MTNTMQKFRDIEAGIAAALDEAGTTYTATLAQRSARSADGWEHDLWRVVFSRGREQFALNHRTGTGHRTPAPMPNDGGPRPRPGTLMHERLEAQRQPIPPHPAGVLHSVVMDDPRGEEFESWASDCGYDPDSRRVLAIYEQCQQQTREARAFFGPLLDELAEQLADY
jgi:hypothetical protein